MLLYFFLCQSNRVLIPYSGIRCRMYSISNVRYFFPLSMWRISIKLTETVFSVLYQGVQSNRAINVCTIYYDRNRIVIETGALLNWFECRRSVKKMWFVYKGHSTIEIKLQKVTGSWLLISHRLHWHKNYQQQKCRIPSQCTMYNILIGNEFDCKQVFH